MDRKWLWIGGGGLVLVVLLIAMSKSGAATTAASTPPPDTSAQDTAAIQGKYSLASQLVNAAGTLDIVNAENAGAASHDAFSIAAINAQNAGQIGAITADYQGQGYVSSIQGVIATALANIQAKNNVDLSTIDANKSEYLAGLDSNTQIQLAGINSRTSLGLAEIDATTQRTQAQYDYMSTVSSNQTAAEINAKTEQQQTKRSFWGGLFNFASHAAGAAAIAGI